MIDLALTRITQLLKSLGNPHHFWKAVHIAGTNGKGSVLAYISSCVNVAKIPNGRFTSPHLIDVWDCIQVNGQTVEKAHFLEVQEHVTRVNSSENIGATEFELLTATAFEIFKRNKVQLAVIEVGLGGKLDATNVLNDGESSVLVSVITKIGLDHEGFLGTTLKEIAAQKAGIIQRQGVCVVDGSNSQEALDEIERVAQAQEAKVVKSYAQGEFSFANENLPLLGSFQKRNLSCALRSLEILAKVFPQITQDVVERGIKQTVWLGRLQWLTSASNGRKYLLDGAHNPQSAEVLSEFVDTHLRGARGDGRVHYIVAFSKGKDYKSILEILLTDGDSLTSTEFGPVDGMPWVSAQDSKEIVEVAKELTSGTVRSIPIKDILSQPDTAIICGSLYLISNVLRLERDDNRLA